MGSHNGERSGIGILADEIIKQVSIWETYGRQSGMPLPSAGIDLCTPTISPQTPRSVLDARDKIIDSAFTLLQLAAGPSKFSSVAMSYSQTMMALKWLFRFKNFDHVSEEPVAYETVAESANVPVNELKRMLRIVIDSHVFYEPEDGVVLQNSFSREFARDENMRRGIPFFCDVVMPAAAKMADATAIWPDSEASNRTARNMALSNCLTFPQYLTKCNQIEGFTSLMKLLGSEPSQHTGYSAHIIFGFDWASLERDSLVVDLGSGGPCSWKLAEMFPHLRFPIQGPHDKLSIVKDCISIKSPDLLARIDFCPRDIHDQQITHAAQVYFLAGVLQYLPDDEVRDILGNIARVMAPESSVIIVDSLLPEYGGDEPQAAKWESRCRDVTIRQLHNSGARTISQWVGLFTSVDPSLYLRKSTRVSGSIVTMVTQAC